MSTETAAAISNHAAPTTRTQSIGPSQLVHASPYDDGEELVAVPALTLDAALVRLTGTNPRE